MYHNNHENLGVINATSKVYWEESYTSEGAHKTTMWTRSFTQGKAKALPVNIGMLIHHSKHPIYDFHSQWCIEVVSPLEAWPLTVKKRKICHQH